MLRGRDRVESERFVALRSHYGFDSFFCIPGKAGAHEKGGVESEIGRFRRRHLVPVPAVTSVAALSDYKLYLFFTLTVHFDDALIVYLPRHS